MEFKPNIVHFSGHGARDGIVVLDDHEQAQLLSPEMLHKILATSGVSVTCVVLNASYSDSFFKSISDVVRYIIAVEGTLSDTAHLKFSLGFYEALAGGYNILQAFSVGCTCVELENTEHRGKFRLYQSDLSTRRVEVSETLEANSA
jgi:hypothetical protein